MRAQKIVTLPCNNILSIQMLHRENPYERNFETIFSLEQKKVLVFGILQNPIFLFVSPITTEQFNNHTSSSMTTRFIERKLHVAAEKIATTTLDIF